MRDLIRNTDFTLLFLGRAITNIGDSFYYIGAMWLVFDLTGSSAFTGIAAFLLRVPSVFQFLYGPLVDRWDLKMIYLSTQFLQGALVIVIPAVFYFWSLNVWVVLAVIGIVSIVNKFTAPTFTATLPLVVDEERITSANSAFAMVGQGINAVFNGISGVIVAVFGPMMLFIVDSSTFFAAMIFLSLMTIPDREEVKSESNEQTDYVQEIREGFNYLRGSLALELSLLAAFVNFGYGAVIAVLPEFAASIGGPSTFGILMSAVAAGSLLGSLLAAVWDDIAYGKLLVIGYIFTSVFIFLAVVLPGEVLTAGSVFLATIPMGVRTVIGMSMLQSVVDKNLLGRVMSTIRSVDNLMVPVGSIVGGVLATVLSPGAMIYLLALLYFACSVYCLRGDIRTLPRIEHMEETTLGLEQ